MAVVETEPEHGRIIARRHPTFWDFNGHVMFVVIRDLGSRRIRVDANAESFSENERMDRSRPYCGTVLACIPGRWRA